MQNIVIVGGTGLVGREVVKQLNQRSDVQTISLVRRPSHTSQRVQERLFDFSDPQSLKQLGTSTIPCDVLICCIGTTLKVAGSEAAFVKIDRDIPVNLAKALQANQPQAVFALVSSVGADHPRGFYLKTKAAAEAGVAASGLCHLIVRPSLLLGQRDDFRLAERMAALAAPPIIAGITSVGLGRIPQIARFFPISAERVARTLIHYSLQEPVPSERVIEGADFL